MRQIAIVAISAALVLLAVSVGEADVLEVDCTGGAFTTIQAAVDAAASGDTILIHPCVYEEQVVCVDKELTLRGFGPDETQLLWQDGNRPLDITVPQWGTFRIENMRITRVPDTANAVRWDEHTVYFTDCVVEGQAAGGSNYGEAVVTGSTMDYLTVSGGVRTTRVTDSRIGQLIVAGVQFQAGNSLVSLNSRYGDLWVGCMAGGQCSGDSAGVVHVMGGLDCYATLEAEDCTFDLVDGFRLPYMSFERCTLGDVNVGYVFDDNPCPLWLNECLVTGNVSVGREGSRESEVRPVARGGPATPDGRWMEAGPRLLHNTIIGDVTIPLASFGDAYFDWCWIRGNIVVGESQICGSAVAVVSHNDFVGGLTVTDPETEVHSNISEDPLFCDFEFGDYSLQSCSPCSSAAHDSTNMGAFAIGCDCDIPVRETSWGAIKAGYR